MIDYWAYPPLADKIMADIEQEVLWRFAIAHYDIRRRIGDLAIGDMNVLVVVRASRSGVRGWSLRDRHGEASGAGAEARAIHGR